MSEITGMGLPQYSEMRFGESLSKVARHQLALLCLGAIRDELDRKPVRGKSRGRGRPPSPVGILAHRMRVHPDSVKRWTSLKEVQASDRNAEKLAEMAFWYSPEGVAQILREDMERYGAIMEGWLSRAEANYGASLYGLNEGRYPIGTVSREARLEIEEGG